MKKKVSSWVAPAVKHQRFLVGFSEGLVVLAVMMFGDPNPAAFYVAFVAVAIGWTLRIQSYAVNPSYSSQVIAGLYRYVKHPYLLGCFFTLLGFAFLSRSLMIVLAAMVFVTLLYTLILHTNHAPRISGQLYSRYNRQVPDFLPALIPFPVEGPLKSLGVAGTCRLFFKNPIEWISCLLAIVFLCGGYVVWFIPVPEFVLYLWVTVIIAILVNFTILYFRRSRAGVGSLIERGSL